MCSVLTEPAASYPYLKIRREVEQCTTSDAEARKPLSKKPILTPVQGLTPLSVGVSESASLGHGSPFNSQGKLRRDASNIAGEIRSAAFRVDFDGVSASGGAMQSGTRGPWGSRRADWPNRRKAALIQLQLPCSQGSHHQVFAPALFYFGIFCWQSSNIRMSLTLS
jgi:hypothetical protein